MNNTSLIFGDGHLGQYLRCYLPKTISVSRSPLRSSLRLRSAQQQNIHHQQAYGETLLPHQDLALVDLLNHHYLTQVIFALPPSAANNYLEILKSLLSILPNRLTFVFISSTSLWGAPGHFGPEDRPCPTSKSGSTLQNAELLLKENVQPHRYHRRKLILLRPSGLADEQRHPLLSILRSQRALNWAEPLQLIHCRDVARLVAHLMDCSSKLNQITSCVATSPLHITKGEYYQRLWELASPTPLPSWWQQTPASQPCPRYFQDDLWRRFRFRLMHPYFFPKLNLGS